MDNIQVHELAQAQYYHSKKDICIAWLAKVSIVIMCLCVPIFWVMYIFDEPSLKYEKDVLVTSDNNYAGGIVTVSLDLCVTRDTYIDSITQQFINVDNKYDPQFTTPIIGTEVTVSTIKQSTNYKKNGDWHCGTIQGIEKQIPSSIQSGNWYLEFKNKSRGLIHIKVHDTYYRSNVFYVI